MALLRSAATVGGYTMASRVLGFIRDILTAAFLGAGPVADAFFVAQRLPNLFRSLFAEGAFSAAFVPTFAGMVAHEGKPYAKRFAEDAWKRAVRDAAPDLPCEVEVDTLEQLDEVLGEDVQLILLDNFPVWQTQMAVQRKDSRAPQVQLESSGGLSLDTAAEYAGTGVDYLAVGALTHSVRVLDIGLDM